MLFLREGGLSVVLFRCDEGRDTVDLVSGSLAGSSSSSAIRPFTTGVAGVSSGIQVYLKLSDLYLQTGSNTNTNRYTLSLTLWS